MKKKLLFAALFFCSFVASKVHAQTPYIGEIKMVAFNFAPNGWAKCEGQLLPISQNQALFALLGTTYGGNGTTNFALPDLRGRVPVGTGQGPGLTPRAIGETGGSENNTLVTSNLPPHNHAILAETGLGTTSVPTGAFLANTGSVDREYATTNNTTMGSTGVTGSAAPVNNMQPYLSVTYIIALQGIFPTQ